MKKYHRKLTTETLNATTKSRMLSWILFNATSRPTSAILS